jgi:hypothetical protein
MGRPRILCSRCGKSQYLKRNMVHGAGVLCKYCGDVVPGGPGLGDWARAKEQA